MDSNGWSVGRCADSNEICRTLPALKRWAVFISSASRTSQTDSCSKAARRADIYRSFGPHQLLLVSHPDLTVGAIKFRPFGPSRHGSAAHFGFGHSGLLIFSSQLFQAFLKIPSPTLRQGCGGDGPSQQIDVMFIGAGQARDVDDRYA